MRLLGPFVALVAGVAMLGQIGNAQEPVQLDCDVGSLQDTIDTAVPGTTILIDGTCTESITIDRDIDLVGRERSPTIAPSSGPGIRITGNGTTVAVSGLTITGATDSAVRVGSGSISARFDSVTIVDNLGRQGGAIRIELDSTAEVIDSTISDNQAGEGGAFWVEGALTLEAGTVQGNATEGHGGGVHTSGTLIVLGTTFLDNSCGERGGAIHVESGRAEIDGATISNNLAGGDGAGIHLFAGTLTVSDSDITDNRALDDGGGIENDGAVVTVVDTAIVGNSAVDDGGGVKNDDRGDMTIIDSVVSQNIAGEEGGGYYAEMNATATLTRTLVSLNSAARGGGITNRDGSTVMVVESSIVDNAATGGIGGGFSGADRSATSFARSTIATNGGGGLHVEGGSTLELVNSTVSGNLGGPAVTADASQAHLVHVTAVDHRDGSFAGTGTTTVVGSIVVGGGPVDCLGPIVSDGFNLLGGGCARSETDLDADAIDDLGIQPLGETASILAVHALTAESPAIGLVDDCPVERDQLGGERPVLCTAGALEFRALQPTTTTITAAASSTTTEAISVSTTSTTVSTTTMPSTTTSVRAEPVDDGASALLPGMVALAVLGGIAWLIVRRRRT